MNPNPNHPIVLSAANVHLPERRRAPRFTLLSLATVLGENGQAGHCTVQDLSSGGALLTGAVPLVVGEAVQVVLPLRGERPVTMVGRVVRRRAPAGVSAAAQVQVADAGAAGNDGARLWAYGVMFVGASLEAAKRALRHTVGQGAVPTLAPQRAPVLVVDGSVDACAPTVAVLAAAGVPGVAVTTAFDALGWVLGGHEFAACVVNPQPRTADGVSLLRYLADEHPGLRRVAIHVGGAERQSMPAQLVLHGPLGAAHVQQVVRPR